MLNFVNYKVEIKDLVPENLENDILDFLKNNFDKYGMAIREDSNNYLLVVNDDLNYSKLNVILTELFNKYNLSLICYKQVFIRKNNFRN